jgi:hypothetical protein
VVLAQAWDRKLVAVWEWVWGLVWVWVWWVWGVLSDSVLVFVLGLESESGLESEWDPVLGEESWDMALVLA